MKALYYLRVFFVSYEFMFLSLSAVIYFFFGESLEKHFLAFSINEDASKWAMLFPISIVGWTFKDGVSVLFPDDKTSMILHKWPDFWRLRVHFNVGVMSSIIYLLPCIGVWFIGGLTKFDGAWLFVTFAFATSLNAFSFYTAKINIRSALVKAHE